MFRSKKTIPAVLSDEELMAQASSGDRAAFEMVYDRYFNKLVWFARGFVSDLQQAEDLVQDVFIKVIESPEKFDRDKKFSTWIYVVVSNQCKQALRNQKNRLRIVEENIEPFLESSVKPETNSDARLLKEKINVICAGLSEKESNIFTLRFEQELSIKEIAEIINIPEGSVKSGIYYLLKKFAHQLKEFNHEY